LQPSTSVSYADSLSLANGKSKGKGKELLNGIGAVESSGVHVHRRAEKGADVVRAVTEVPVGECVDLESFKAVLQTPEVRSACEWYPSVRRDGVKLNWCSAVQGTSS
jgi:hypothetical protein